MRYLVALDGSDAAIAGLEWVATLPLTADDEVMLLSVAEPDTQLQRSRRQHTRHLRLLLDAAWEARRREARRLLDDAATKAAGWVTPVRQLVREGRPDVEIPRAAEAVGADVVICGPRGRGRLASLLIGSVTRSLLATTRRPLLIARRPVVLPDPILVAVDGSAAGRAVVQCACSLPWTLHASFIVVTVASSPVLTLSARDRRLLVEGERAHALRIADEAVSTLRAAGRTAEASIGTGDAANVIVSTARRFGAGLVIVGTHGAGGVRGLVVGSVAESVVATGPCSVLAVPPGPRGQP